MTAPDKRRPLPALVVIAALTLLTALVWFRVLHRGTGAHEAATTPSPTPTLSAPGALPKPGAIDVIVVNASGRNGLARAVTKLLDTDGFQMSTQANDGAQYFGSESIKSTSEIRYGPTGLAGATTLSYYVPGACLLPVKSASAQVILALGLKYKSLASAAAATAAIAKADTPRPSASPSPPSSPAPAC
jgi:hypothetical protein